MPTQPPAPAAGIRCLEGTTQYPLPTCFAAPCSQPLLTLLLPFCVQSVFVEKNPLGPTVGGIYSQCSHNKSRINMQNSLVAERVRLPCAGNT